MNLSTQYFFMLVGLPGSGKSWYAENKLSHAVIHSSDAIREELLNNVDDQSQQELVFQTLHDRVIRDLQIGLSVVYDATNISYKRRRVFLQQVKGLHIPGLKTVCVFMATPYSKCVENIANRERTVPENVIHRMYQNIDIPMKAEGWDAIWIENVDPFIGDINFLLSRLAGMEHDNPHHEFTVGQHMLTAYEYFDKNYSDMANDIPLGRAVALHDIGKEFTKVFHDSKGNPTDIAHYYNHERVGAYESFAHTADLLSKDDQLRVALLIRWHMAPFAVEKSDHPSKTERKFKDLLGEDIWSQVMILHDCDLHAH